MNMNFRNGDNGPALVSTNEVQANCSSFYSGRHHQNDGSVVLSVCPDCDRPNYSSSNWCTDCGCLLIGVEDGNQSIHSTSYVDCRNNSISIPDNNPGLLCQSSGNTVCAGSFPGFPSLPTENTFYTPPGVNFSQSMQPVISQDLLLSSQHFVFDRYPQVASAAGSLTWSNYSYAGNGSGFSGDLPSELAELAIRGARQRCISGPCNPLATDSWGNELNIQNFATEDIYRGCNTTLPISDPCAFAHQCPENHNHAMYGGYCPYSYAPAADLDPRSLQPMPLSANTRSLSAVLPSQSTDAFPSLGLPSEMIGPVYPVIASVRTHSALECSVPPSGLKSSSFEVLSTAGASADPRAGVSTSNYAQQPFYSQGIPRRRWQSSSLAWSAHDPCTLKKRPSRRPSGSSNPGAPHRNGNQLRQCYPKEAANQGVPPNQRVTTKRGRKANAPASAEASMKSDLFIPPTQSLIDGVKELAEFNKLAAKVEATDENCITPDWLGLPNEVWLNILKHTRYSDRSAIAVSCHRLHCLVSDSSIWRVISLERYQHLSDSGLAELGRRRPHELHLKYCKGESISVQGIKKMFAACGDSLKKLSFIGCSKGAFQGDVFLILSAVYCQYITHLDASYAYNVRDQAVKAISESFRGLRNVRLNGAQNISNSAIKHLVCHHKATLERLELFGCFRLNSKIFPTLGECHGLKALAFGFLHHLTSVGFLELIAKLPKLASLDLRGTQSLVTDACLTRLADKCPYLEEIVLANMHSLTREDGVVKMLRNLPRLRVLDLCGLTVVGNNTIQALASSCPHLEELDISCTSVTEVGLLHLADAPALSLKSLCINNCHQISSNALEKVAKACPRLATLSVYGYTWISDWDFLLSSRPGLIIQTEKLNNPSTQRSGQRNSRNSE